MGKKLWRCGKGQNHVAIRLYFANNQESFWSLGLVLAFCCEFWTSCSCSCRWEATLFGFPVHATLPVGPSWSSFSPTHGKKIMRFRFSRNKHAPVDTIKIPMCTRFFRRIFYLSVALLPRFQVVKVSSLRADRSFFWTSAPVKAAG